MSDEAKKPKRRKLPAVNPAETDLARPVERPLLSATEMYRETPGERFMRKRAQEELKKALVMHQPVVKRCVVERLCHHKPHEQLAQELCLTADEVKDILAKMRRWVGRYTTYFEHDWFWQDGSRLVLPNV
jgi:DNA-directed RNA polymerase specialized sigma24 family protein